MSKSGKSTVLDETLAIFPDLTKNLSADFSSAIISLLCHEFLALKISEKYTVIVYKLSYTKRAIENPTFFKKI